MALDIIIKTTNSQSFTEMSQDLHTEIFNSPYISTCKMLSKIKDFYKANEIYDCSKKDQFLGNLITISKHISIHKIELEELITHLEIKDITEIRITGD